MTIYNWLTLLGIPGMIAGLFGFIKIQAAQNRAMKLGLQAILRDRLLQSYRYFSTRGWAGPEDRQNFENMYSQYHSLGANGVMDDIRNKFMALPVYEQEKGETK